MGSTTPASLASHIPPLPLPLHLPLPLPLSICLLLFLLFTLSLCFSLALTQLIALYLHLSLTLSPLSVSFTLDCPSPDTFSHSHGCFKKLVWFQLVPFLLLHLSIRLIALILSKPPNPFVTDCSIQGVNESVLGNPFFFVCFNYRVCLIMRSGFRLYTQLLLPMEDCN